MKANLDPSIKTSFSRICTICPRYPCGTVVLMQDCGDREFAVQCVFTTGDEMINLALGSSSKPIRFRTER